jgi:tetratricopeptide (TPR) repeat protein
MLVAESDIATQIAAAFTTAITPGERQRIGKPVSQSPVAYDLYLQAKKLNPANAETTARAIDLLKQAVDIDPRFASAMAEIGYRSLYPRRIDEAYRWAQRAIDTDPDLADGYVALAGANADRGMASKARAEWLKALELDPNRLQPMQYLVSATLDVGQFEESLHWGRLALERNPKAPKNLAMVAGTLLALGDFPDADRLLQLGEQHFPNSYLVPQMRAMEAIAKEDPAQALQNARNLRAARPKAVEVQALLADMALAAGSPDAEGLNRGFYQEALDQSFSNWLLFPESARVRFAYFAWSKGDETAARKWLDEAEVNAIQCWKRGVESPLIAVEMAVIQALRKNNDRAMEWMQRAYDRGWRIRASSVADPMLSNLRSDTRFRTLLQHIQADLDRARSESAEIRELSEKTIPFLSAALK